jgi:hypothetical protein
VTDRTAHSVAEGAQDLRPLRELRSVVERITYQCPDNGYTVARLGAERAGAEAAAPRRDDQSVKVADTLADPAPGEAIVAPGLAAD